MGLIRLHGVGLSFLRGRTNYGDSVEDEWLIVYLLRELSRTFTDLWIKTVDTDGEFLLIEAANVLPSWLNPENADNRVCGQLTPQVLEWYTDLDRCGFTKATF